MAERFPPSPRESSAPWRANTAGNCPARFFAGQCRLIEKGFRQGGPAGYGLRRLLIDQNGAPKMTLMHGEQKSLQTDPVVLVPGPEGEVSVVAEIYHAFVKEGRSEAQIAERLNARGILTDLG